MKYLFGFLVVILFFNFSCKNEKLVQDDKKDTNLLKQSSKLIVNTIGERLSPSAKLAIKDWKEYDELADNISKYYSISILEALNSAQELSDLVLQMKDSLSIEVLNKPIVIVRLNVLHNETLRLTDMSKIPSISDKEVKEEVTNILQVYAAVNSRINTIYKAINIQNSLDIDTETSFELEVKNEMPPAISNNPRLLRRNKEKPPEISNKRKLLRRKKEDISKISTSKKQ